MSDEVSAVSLKLPIFWPHRASTWFIQAEAQFSTRKIDADDTKYSYTVAALDEETATRVIDLLESPPAKGRYRALKQRLLETFTLSESERASRLLSMSGLSDTKPSLLMDRMLALLGSHPPCFLFRELFLQQLPNDIRCHLVHSGLVDCRELARLADSLWTTQHSTVNAVRPRPTAASSRPTPTRRPSVSTPVESEQPDLCFYHKKFGSAARQCRPPCSFRPPGNSASGRQ